MSFPLINKQAIRGINIPEMSGGINLRDAIYSVNDNQLTDCKNMWFKDGVLKSRLGSCKSSETETFASYKSDANTQCREWEVYRTYDDVTYKLHSIAVKSYGKDGDGEIVLDASTKFYLVPEKNETKEVITLPSLPFYLEGFLTQYDSVLYAFGKVNKSVTVTDTATNETTTEIVCENVIYKLDLEKVEPVNILPSVDMDYFASGSVEEVFPTVDNTSGVGSSDDLETNEDGDEETDTEEVLEWKFLTTNDIYIPTVMTDCKCSKDGKSDFSSAQGESYNRLCDLCKIEYSSVNRDLLDISDETSTHEMRYYIPNVGNEESDDILDYFSLEIKYPDGISVTKEDGSTETIYSVTHKFADYNGASTYYEFEMGATNSQPDGVWIAGWVRPNGSMRVSFFTNATVVATGLTVKAVTAADYLRNNIIITMPCKSGMNSEIKEEIFNSNIATWYGGEASGIFGGTRLFIAGGGKNKVIWSDLNNPLYFPEDCDMNVGERDEDITAFGKQNEQLVIFKEHSVWGSNYAFDSNITGEELVSQSVVNYEANVAYFPLIQLHPNIGCRVPGSIELCRNRLVWADLNGKVYTLVSQSQYSERNVYELSEMIERKLKGCDKAELQKATSADFEGYYVLCVGKQMFLMDYNCYGYTHCYSYSKTEDNQKLIPWWYWDIPLKDTEKVEGIFTLNGRLYYILSDTDSKYNTLSDIFNVKHFDVYCFDDDMRADGDKVFTSIIETKSFSFGTMQYLKHISAFNIALNGSGEVRVKYIGSKPEHEQEEVFSLYSDSAEAYSPYYMQNIFLRPNMRFTATFGVRIECDSSIALGSVSLNYRLLGGNK